MDGITAYFDGLCAPCNPGGVATWGVVVVKDEEVIHTGCGLACEPYTPMATNNLAEYTALIKALEICIQNDFSQIRICGDSQLVIYQMTGKYSVRSPNIVPLYQAASALAQKLKGLSFEWVKRELNALADEMSNNAYREHAGAGAGMAMPFGKYKGELITTVAKKDHLTQVLLNNR